MCSLLGVHGNLVTEVTHRVFCRAPIAVSGGLVGDFSSFFLFSREKNWKVNSGKGVFSTQHQEQGGPNAGRSNPDKSRQEVWAPKGGGARGAPL